MARCRTRLGAVRLVVLLLGLLLLAGCRLDVRTVVDLDHDAAGELTFDLVADEPLVAMLAEAGVDPLADLEQLSTPGWTIRPLNDTELAEVREDQLLPVEAAATDALPDAAPPAAGVRLSGEVAPGGLDDALATLQEGLDERTGLLAEQLEARRTPTDALRVQGEAGIVLPEVVGFTGPGAPERGDLLALVEEQPGAFHHEVVVRGPSELTGAVGEEAVVDGNTLREARWLVPLGEQQVLDVRFSPPSPGPTPVQLGLAAALFVLALGLLVLGARRFRAARRAQQVSPAGA